MVLLPTTDKENRALPLRRLLHLCTRTCDAGVRSFPPAASNTSHYLWRSTANAPMRSRLVLPCTMSMPMYFSLDICTIAMVITNVNFTREHRDICVPGELQGLHYPADVPSLYDQEAKFTLRLERSSCDRDAFIQCRLDGCRCISHDVLHDRVVGSVTRGCFETHGPNLPALVPAP